MGPLNIVLAILLFASAIFLIIAVLIQSGKSKGVSGAIAGGTSETYFGKNKGKSRDKQLSLLTTIVAIVFAVLALITYVTQDYIEPKDPITTTAPVTLPSSNKPTSSVNASDKTEDTNDALPDDDKDDVVGGEGDTTTSSVTSGDKVEDTNDSLPENDEVQGE